MVIIIIIIITIIFLVNALTGNFIPSFQMLQEKFLTNNTFEVSQVFVSMVSKTQLNFVKLSPQVSKYKSCD
jgi:ABC-type transport system involved in multi-copper enzyme maturation permease subunit